MEVDEEISFEVTQFHKGTRFGKNKSKNRSSSNEFFGKTGRKFDEFYAARRHEIYQRRVQKFYSRVQELDSVIQSVRSEDLIKKILRADLLSDNLPAFEMGFEIFGSDEANILEKCKSELVARDVSHSVVLLKPESCKNLSSTLKQFVKKLGIEIEDQDLDLSTDSNPTPMEGDEGIEESPETVEAVSRFIDRTRRKLELSWFVEKFDALCLAGKRTCRDQPIVVFVERAAEFSQDVLDDLIKNLCSVKKHIPVVLVMCTTTSRSSSGLESHISVASQKRLDTVKIRDCAPEKYFDAFFEEMIATAHSNFFLGGKCVSLLNQAFNNVDCCIAALKDRYALCLQEHYNRRPESVFCDNPDSVSDFIDSLSDSDLEVVKSLKSYQKFCELLETEDPEVESLKESLKVMAVELPLRMKEWIYAMRILCAMSGNLIKSNIVSFRKFYSFALATRDIYEHKMFQGFIQRIQTCTKDDLISALETGQSQEEFIGIPQSQQTERTRNLIEFFPWALGLLGEGAGSSTDGDSEGKAAEKSPELPKRTLSRVDLKKTLRKEIDKEREKRNPDEKIRNKIVDTLVNLLKIHDHPTSYMWNEICFFDDNETIQTTLFGHSRDFIVCVLNDPSCILGCKCCLKKSATKSMPDTSLAFHLLCEFDVAKVPLRSWLDQFDFVVTDGENVDQDPSVDVQARFVQAVAELHLLGYIKPASRPVDHVEKLF